ncbi:phosphoglycerate mutase [Cognatilysobacter bugurensis]|uniref:phosphoglycerate mutase n=1 Tax=Cognatilysobacter bugurensis TaxID=543356 RepID=UPI001672C1C6|nr:phosphoglycerate mutase [Lysobacter bugurensis]
MTLLLPGRDRLRGQPVPAELGRRLARGDRRDFDGALGAQLFDVLPRGWPAAAVTRARDAGDAAGACWLRADPAFVRAEINGARLLAHGEALGLDREQADALMRPLRLLFGDAGFVLDAPVPSRWYLRLPTGVSLPRFASPDEALGADLFEHLPADAAAPADGRRWRALLSEAQVTLHNHPVNADRAQRGFAPVNSVWFWGAGAAPDRVSASIDAIYGADDATDAFGHAAAIERRPLPSQWGDTLAAHRCAIDLRGLRDISALHERWVEPAARALDARRVTEVRVLFEDGLEYRLASMQRWRVWRRPVEQLADDTAADE